MSAARLQRTLTMVTVGLLAAGCGGGPDVAGPDGEPGATPQPSPAVEGAVPADVLDQARTEAADEAGVAAEEVEVVRAEDVRWSSSALGCPQEDMAYSQVVTDGYWVVLQAGGREFDFRASDGGPVVLCEGGGEPPMETEDG